MGSTVIVCISGQCIMAPYHKRIATLLIKRGLCYFDPYMWNLNLGCGFWFIGVYG